MSCAFGRVRIAQPIVDLHFCWCSSLSLHVMIMSWHRVQHIPNTAYTQDCLSSLHYHDYKLTPECSFSFRRASLHHRPPSATSPWELQGKVTLSHSHGWELTNWWKESQHPARHPSTAFQYSSKLTRLRPPSASPNSLDYGLEVHLQTHSIPVSKLAQLRPPSVSPNLLKYGVQLHLHTRLITISECISKFTWSRPPSVSL